MATTGLLENDISFVRAPPIALHARNVTISASKTNKVLVNSFSVDLPSGSVMAVMGGSGSGKTTLLNVLASKVSKGLQLDGEIHYALEDNSEHFNADTEASMAYLPQHDVLPARLTCRETLMIAADLKLKSSLEKKNEIVDQLLLELGLRDCANTLVGDARNRGLSGGEKRRLSVATQLVSNPSFMFLDEPTTGLDAYSAFLLVKSLKKLARDGQKSFIMSVHQPRSDIMFLLDSVCILSKGNVVYCGKTTEMIPYFDSLGYSVPHLVNPADYFVDLSSVDARTEYSKKKSQELVDQLVQQWDDHQSQMMRLVTFDTSRGIHPRNMAARVSFWKQVEVLTRRNIKLNSSDHFTLVATFTEPALVGAIMGWIFYKPNPNTQEGLRTLTSSLYATAVLQCYLYLLFDTYRLTEQDIILYDRERAEGIVSPASFMLARKLLLFWTDDIMMILIFVTISYFMIGLEVSAKKFFLHFSVVFLIQLSCSGLALFSVAISRDFAKASLVGNMSFTLLSLACGFFVNAKSMPVYVRWTKYIAFTWYGFGALVSNTYTDKLCHSSNKDQCEGNALIHSLGFWPHWRSLPFSILFCFALGNFGAALIMFYIKKVDIALQNEVKPSKTEDNDGLEGDRESSLDDTLQEIGVEKVEDLESKLSDFVPITVTLKNINLEVMASQLSKSPRHGWLQKKTKQILQDVNAVFKPGMINAIMGPSGSGKSSLLNLISGRSNSSLLVKFHSTGSILLNTNSISKEMFKSVCSYVSQDDDHLLASLTVRETFEFAAALRLHYMTSQQRRSKIDEILLALGLTHCENTVIGNEFVKGISGGEKRRVTIGVQLLNNSPILLLDEPTSGLDSFTSAAILEILENLCTEDGKTVIITIHQPRSELFQKFGHVLLLARSGRAAFNGSPNEMINYFANIGHVCPPYTNVADYFLDLISVNTQNEQNEMISRQRVESLLDNWRLKGNDIMEDPVLNWNEMSKGQFLGEYDDFIKKPCNAVLAYFVNLRRQYTTTRRNIDSLMARVAQVPGSGIIFALYWAPIKHNFKSVGNRLGLAQQSTALYFIGMLANLACYPAERDYFYEEYNDNVHGIAPFFLAYMTLELPLTAFSSSIYAVFTVLVCGLPRTAGNFFATMYCAFVIIACGEALGIMTNTFFRRPGFVVNCISVILSIGTQLSGLMSLHMSRVLKGINYLNPLNYTSMILINYSFPSDMKLTCEDGGRKPDGSCQFSNGHDVLREYGLVKNTQKYLGIIICVMIIYRLLSYWVLKAKLEWIKW
ncbi:ZYRO0B05588p [Zygosaccharomyces rouxii]|uniref:ZYRO0B05588p n=1 Tax=Zygosaccharomyces rouxii (strain ATCC 2623 / CBS 732 / NBRC 1130 / NCYC 568 / NRRL Y-229) TaxID=559307 RepID=C5DR51_ZYGRC|nr:uncharacterized protein ZYRO0B05588g [Zygosaccharomyces rouxii]KAH9200192.1 P-loop containing nucleoside triphosphate hydrolase protein [Zygosaccharomyces rouxii]CAR26262.1 ZYRO0B05588p [Zygosaccharomyces rouxii]